MLCQDFDPGLWRDGMLLSEKLDGVRAIWDGSSLRTRTGQTIACPDWFTAGLGRQMLDGELWIGREAGDFDLMSGMARSSAADPDAWRNVRYAVFDLYMGKGSYRARYRRLSRTLPPESEGGFVYCHKHRGVTDFKSATELLERVKDMGGEGIVIRDPDEAYTPGRGMGMFRMKNRPDLDAIVVGYMPGNGRLSELVGSLICHVDGSPHLEFRLGNGLTDRDRIDPPRIGQRVVVAHSGLTTNNLPRLPVYRGVRAEQ